MTDSGFYGYAVVAAAPERCCLGEIAGVEPAVGPVRIHSRGSVALLVSEVAAHRVPMTTHNLESHERVVEAAFSNRTVLPLRFGTVFQNEDELDSFLGAHAEPLGKLLHRFRDTVELRLKASYFGEGMLREVVAFSPQIRRLKARLAHHSGAAGYYDQIALGEEVARALQRLQERDRTAWSSRLRRHVVAERELERGDEKTVFRTAYLLRTEDLVAFDREVSRIADEERDRTEVVLVGPLAPWDFAEMAGPSGSVVTRSRRKEGSWVS